MSTQYPSEKKGGDHSVSKAIYPKEMEEENFGAFDRCDLCEKKGTPGKTQKTPERSYQKERPKKGKRPPAQSYTSYESCDICERKEVPGMHKSVDMSDDSCVICEKKKTPERGRKTSPGSGYTRGSAYSSKGYSGKEKKAPERSYESFDSCDLCDKKEPPRVATPERVMELKRKNGSIRDTYAEKPRPAYHNNDRGYGKTEMYEKRRKTSPRGYGAAEGDKFRKWKEMEKNETRPLRMTGSITQRRPRNIRKEPRDMDHYPRQLNQFAFGAEMMDANDEDDEEMPDEMSPSIENRINEIKERISEKCAPREKGKGPPKGLTGSSSKKRASKAPRHDECFGRHQEEFLYSGEVMNDEQDMSSEVFEPHVESTIKIVKKKISRTSFPNEKRKISPKRVKDSVSIQLPNDARKEGKHKDLLKKHRAQETNSRGMKENGKIDEKFPSHSGRGIKTMAKKTSPTKLPDVKRKSLKGFREEDMDEFSDSDEIDFEEHKNHPKDHAKSYEDVYEKYVNENGSEIWIKAEEKYSELHHIP